MTDQRLRLIRWFASKLPLRRIYVDDEPYLDRYYIAGPMPESLAELWPENERPRARLGWLRRTWYLHRFHRPDEDRHLHNHPWSAVGLILHGSYIERRIELGVTLNAEGTRTLVPGNKQVIDPNTYHAVVELLDADGRLSNEVWTLFGTGPKVQSWGYLVDGEHVPWREYQAEKYGEHVLEQP